MKFRLAQQIAMVPPENCTAVFITLYIWFHEKNYYLIQRLQKMMDLFRHNLYLTPPAEQHLAKDKNYKTLLLMAKKNETLNDLPFKHSNFLSLWASPLYAEN